VQAPTLQGERLLIVEDEPLIAVDLQLTLEREGARVILARTIPQALRYADYPALSAGVIDFYVGSENAEPVCEALMRREVPFIFFTGVTGPLSERWSATPVLPKPTAPKAIIGALKFVLSPDVRDIIVKRQRDDTAKLVRIDQAISEGEERIERMRCSISQLASFGADTSVAETVVATMTDLVENMRAHRQMSAQLASKAVR